jgi:2-polyprenyl-6-methoxyphenol hydroxylase-like FAD-dependent oxidoreductase
VEEVPVLVVGAGPVGLTLALVLDHHGVRCRIIDRADTPGQLSKAGGVQARTLEILDELDLADPILEPGVRMTASEIRTHGYVIGDFRDDPIAGGSRYPFVLGLPQSTVEQVLTDRLLTRGIEVERGVELGECRQDELGMTAILRDRDGAREIVRTRWLAGCDGPNSTVREALRIPFHGDEHRTGYALADVELVWNRAPDTTMILLEDHGAMQVHPIGPDRWRVAVDRGPIRAHGRPTPPTPEDVQDLCDAYLPIPARVGTLHWSTSYCVHHRAAFRYRARRAFLVGDAAHVHSPITYQGMNAGIQDAWNLGWKLAMAERGTATELLLDSYDAERRAADEHLTCDTTQVELLFSGRDLITDRARGLLFPFVAALPGYERQMGRRTSHLSFGYRGSPAVGGRPSSRLHPGDRAPDAPFTTDSGVRIRDGRSYVSLLFTGDHDDADLTPVVDMILPGTVPIRPVLVTKVAGLRSSRSGTSIVNDTGGGVHQAWGITRPTHVLVRPDGYIGWRADPPDAEAATRFLAGLHGVLPPDRPPTRDAARSERLNG